MVWTKEEGDTQAFVVVLKPTVWVIVCPISFLVVPRKIIMEELTSVLPHAPMTSWPQPRYRCCVHLWLSQSHQHLYSGSLHYLPWTGFSVSRRLQCYFAAEHPAVVSRSSHNPPPSVAPDWWQTSPSPWHSPLLSVLSLALLFLVHHTPSHMKIRFHILLSFL